MYFFPYLEAVCCSMSSSNSCFSIRWHISQEAGQVVWCSHLLKNFSHFVVIHSVQVFGIVNKAEIVFCNSHAFLMIQWMFKVWSLVPLPYPNLTYTSGSSWFTYCWSLAWRILSITLLACGCNCAVFWTFFGVAVLWDWNENWPFLVLWPLLNIPNLLAYWIQHFHLIVC